MDRELLFDPQTKAADIVVMLPAASRLMQRYRIDYCCGGDQPMFQVLREQGVDAETFYRELEHCLKETEEQAEGGMREDWSAVSDSGMIDYIVDTRHAYLRRSLPEIRQLVTTVFRVHGLNHKELEKVYKIFLSLQNELELHMIHEEQEAFPVIKRMEEDAAGVSSEELIRALTVLEDEHAVAGGLLRSLREITADYALPGDACPTYQLAFAKLQELESDLFRHIHLENNILFPRVRNKYCRF